jgi:transcription regulator MmyB-like protein
LEASSDAPESIASASFRRFWGRHDVLNESRAPKLIHHPVAGDLHFTFQSFALPDDPDQLLVTFTVEPGSPSDDRLRMLASLDDAPVPDTQ